MSATHAELVDCARRWLARRCPVVATEVVTAAGETPDAIGWRGYTTVVIECKTSRSDFAADRQKFFRVRPEHGMGYQRYFMTPTGLVRPDEIPADWGLLEVGLLGVKVARESQKFTDRSVKSETLVLVSLLRRVGAGAPPGVSIKCYTVQTGCTATLTTSPDTQSSGCPDDTDGDGNCGRPLCQWCGGTGV